MLGGRYGRIQAVLCAGARGTRKGCKEVGADGEVADCNKADTLGGKGVYTLPARSFWRWISALVTIILLLPTTALAQSGFSWCSVDGPFVTGGTTYDKGYVVLNCSNANLAALAVIGRSGDYLQLTSDQLAKLSNESTGGAFYTLTSRFRAVGASGNQSPYYPSWWGSGSVGNVQSGFQIDNAYAALMVDVSGGYGTVWAVETSAAQIASALEDYEVIYNGGNLGGGSGGGSGDMPTTLHVTMDDWVAPESRKIYGTRPTEPLNVTLDIDVTNLVNRIGSVADDYDHAYFIVWRNERIYGSGYVPTIDVYLSDNAATVDSSYNINISSPVYGGWQVGTTGSITNNATNSLGIESRISSGGLLNGNLSYSVSGKAAWLVDAKGTSSTPVTPPNNWPDPPSNPTPSPPTVPDPPTDTPVTQPTPPTDPTPPTYPITSIYEGDTYVVADIAAILDAMDEHCQHLQQAIYNAASDLYESLSSYLQDEFQATRQEIRDGFGWLVGCVHDEFEGLMSYLQELFDWLAGQFSFTYSGGTYNDSSVISWLRMIYLKLGNGGGNTRPVDPVSDPIGIGKWLNDLWAGFLAALLGIGANGIGAVTSGLQTLTTKFPFSIPWDIAALLALLVAEPVAPVVEVPQFAVDAQYGLVQLQDMRIDLSVYDTYWGPVRIIEKIGFAVFLATQTKDMLDLLGSALVKER